VCCRLINDELDNENFGTAERRRSQHPTPVVKPPNPVSNGTVIPVAPPPAPPASVPNFSSKKNKKEKKKITKADIGLPSNFTHVSHVGWDANKGFALDNVEPHLLQFFAKVQFKLTIFKN
jgi:P21-Rho-binding domain